MSLTHKYDDLFYSIYEYYIKNIADVSFLNFENIYYTDCMKEDLFLFYSDKRMNTDIHGATLLQNKSSNNLVVLIDVSSENVLTYAISIIHELTHAYDFKIFADYYKFNNIFEIQNHDMFYTYRTWSEFKAHFYGEVYSFKYIDTVTNTNNLEVAMKNYNVQLESFLINKRKMMKNLTFDGMSLASVLGAIFLYDYYNNVSHINNSCIYQYLPIIFHTEIINKIYQLYYIYFDSAINNNIFIHLKEIKMIEDLVYT